MGRIACHLLVATVIAALLPVTATPMSGAAVPSPSAWYRLPVGIHDVWIENGTLLYIDYDGIWVVSLSEPASPQAVVEKRCSRGFFYPGGAVLIGAGMLTQYVMSGVLAEANYTGPLPEPYLLIRSGDISYVVGGGRLYAVSPRGIYVYEDPELDPRYTDIQYSAANGTLYLLLPRTWYSKAYYFDREQLAAEALIPIPRIYINTGGKGLLFIDSDEGSMKMLAPAGTLHVVQGAGEAAAAMKRFLAAAAWGGHIYVYGETGANTTVLVIDAESRRLASIIYYTRLAGITGAVFWNHTVYVATEEHVLYDKNPFSGTYTVLASHGPVGWKIDYAADGHLAFSSARFVAVLRRDWGYRWSELPPGLGHPACLGPRGGWAVWVISNSTAYGALMLSTTDMDKAPLFIPTMSPGPAGWPADGSVVDGSYMRITASGNDTVFYNPAGLIWIRGGRYVYSHLKQPYSIPALLNHTLYYVLDGYLVEVFGNGSARSYGPVSHPDMLCMLLGINDTIYVLNMMPGPYTGYVYPYSLSIVVRRNGVWMISRSLDIMDEAALYRRDLLYSYAWLRAVRKGGVYAVSISAPISTYYPLPPGNSGSLNALRIFGVIVYNASGTLLYRGFWRQSYAATVVENALVPGYTARYSDTYMSISGILLSPGTAPAATRGVVLGLGDAVPPNSTLFDAAAWGAVYVDIVNGSVLDVLVETGSAERRYRLDLGGSAVPGVAVAAGEPGYLVSLRVYGERNYTLLYGRAGGAASLMELDENYRAFYGSDTLYLVKIYGGNYSYAEPGDAIIYRVDPYTMRIEPFLDPSALNTTLLVLDPLAMEVGGEWFMSPGLVHAGGEHERLWIAGKRYFIGTLLWSGGGEVYVLRAGPWGSGLADGVYVYSLNGLPELPRPPGRGEGVVRPLPEPLGLAPVLAAALLATASRRRARRR